MRNKSFISAALCSLLLLETVAVTASCGAASGAGDTTSGDTNTASSTQDTTTEPESKLEVKDFGGYNIRILARLDTGSGAWATIDTTAEEENGEAINDAVYRRNRQISEDYNVTFESIFVDANQHVNLVSQSVLAGDDNYDLILVLLSNQATLSMQNYLVNLNDLDYLDLKKSCWDVAGNECLKIAGKNYCAMGDLNITDNDATYCTLFNKQILASYPDIPDLYELVNSGKWTLDKLREYSTIATSDVNGDGAMSWDTDRFGVIDQYEVGVALLLGAGENTCELDNDGLLSYNLGSEKIVSAFEKIYNFFSDPSYQLTADASQYSSVTDKWNTLARGGFKANRALFFMGPIVNVRLIRDMETDFGILPTPKLTDDQSEYYSMLQAGNATAYSIPVTVADPSRSALILEALCEGSTDTLLTAYYDTTLKRKASRDNESSAMLDLIFSNHNIDFCNTFTSIGINTFIINMLKQTTNTFVSSEASGRDAYIANIEKINTAYSEQK